MNNEQEEESVLQRIVHEIMNITDQNQPFINDLIESNEVKKKWFLGFVFKSDFAFLMKVSHQRQPKSILSDIFLRCLMSAKSTLIRSLIG